MLVPSKFEDCVRINKRRELESSWSEVDFLSLSCGNQRPQGRGGAPCPETPCPETRTHASCSDKPQILKSLSLSGSHPARTWTKLGLAEFCWQKRWGSLDTFRVGIWRLCSTLMWWRKFSRSLSDGGGSCILFPSVFTRALCSVSSGHKGQALLSSLVFKWESRSRGTASDLLKVTQRLALGFSLLHGSHCVY